MDTAVAAQVEIGSHSEALIAAPLLITHSNTDHYTDAEEALHHTIMRLVMFSLQYHTLGTHKVNYSLIQH